MKKRVDNPGAFARGRTAFANADGSWTEDIDAVAALDASLRRNGHFPVMSDALVMLPELDLAMMPLVVGGIQPRPEGGVQTVTTVQLSHPTLLPSGIFEFQHAIGVNTSAALERGFDDLRIWTWSRSWTRYWPLRHAVIRFCGAFPQRPISPHASGGSSSGQ